jgi:hypothetical protein
MGCGSEEIEYPFGKVEYPDQGKNLMDWTITTTEGELHHTTMVGKAMDKRITWKVEATRLQANKRNITHMFSLQVV